MHVLNRLTQDKIFMFKLSYQKYTSPRLVSILHRISIDNGYYTIVVYTLLYI